MQYSSSFARTPQSRFPRLRSRPPLLSRSPAALESTHHGTPHQIASLRSRSNLSCPTRPCRTSWTLPANTAPSRTFACSSSLQGTLTNIIYRLQLTRVVNRSIPVRICSFQNVQQLLCVFSIAQTRLQFVETDAAITVLVQLLKDILQLVKLLRVRLHCYRHQRDLFELLRMLKLLHSLKIQLCKKLLILLLARKILDPLMLQGFLSCQSAFRLRD